MVKITLTAFVDDHVNPLARLCECLEIEKCFEVANGLVREDFPLEIRCDFDGIPGERVESVDLLIDGVCEKNKPAIPFPQPGSRIAKPIPLGKEDITLAEGIGMNPLIGDEHGFTVIDPTKGKR